MKLLIKVKTNASKPGVEKVDKNNFIIKVSASPEKGKANEAVMKALAEYLGIANWRIQIKGGLTSKNKVVEII